MPIPVQHISFAERDKLLTFHEGHFGDLKSIRIAPGKLTHTISALSNAEGGELYIGIEQNTPTGTTSWQGFKDPEAANAHIQVFEELFPLGDGYSYTFLTAAKESGLVLKVDVAKSRDIKKGSDGVVYVRRGAQNLQVKSDVVPEK